MVYGLLAISILVFNLSRLEEVARAYVAVAAFTAIAGLGGWFAVLRTKPPGHEPLMPREALTRSIPLGGTVLLSMASPWGVTLFMGHFATTAEVGIYRVALQFALLLGFLLAASGNRRFRRRWRLSTVRTGSCRTHQRR